MIIDANRLIGELMEIHLKGFPDDVKKEISFKELFELINKQPPAKDCIRDMFIKDLTNGNVRLYGTNQHDALRISKDGRTLSYENLQNGDGSRYGDYRFTDDKGRTPEEDEELVEYGAPAYFNIGGFK